ncbi:MAG: 3'-5' exonuclease [Deltaproteobacteria bacterium]|nr:3'-5' exonuclease [Deltaproteobacteria bacterium]
MLSFDKGAPWREMSFVSVDVETTGFDREACRVTEVGIVRFERGQIAERWGSLINPGVPIPEDSTKVTGITDAMVADQPSLADLKWEIYGRLRDRLFVAWNAEFDWDFLQNELTRCGLTLPSVPILDPLVWARRLMPSDNRHNLGAICDKFGIPLENAHRAEDDAEACGRVVLRLADKVPVNLGTLLEGQAEWKAAQDAEREQRRMARAIAKGVDPNAPRAAAAPTPEEPKRQAGLF